MSFFRNLFESKPAQTDQEYTISLIDQLLNGEESPYLISNLKEFSHQYPDEISSRGIPDLVKSLSKFSENDDVIKDLITIYAELLRSDNLKKEENAKIFLQCDDTIPNLVRNLDNKTPQIRVGSMHVLMMIANIQPSLFTESLTAHQPQMIRLFGSISDQNEQISSKFVTVIPKLVENNPDFQQIVGFYAFEALVNSINRDRPEFLEALMSVLKDNQINQSLFVNSGYLSIIEKMIKTPDEKILDLMLLLFDPYKNINNLESFRKNLEPTNIITIICNNITRNVYRPIHVHLLSVCIKGNKDLTDRTKEKVPDFVRLALETRKSATINNGNNSYLTGIDLFGEFFESFIFESEENSHFLNLTIINSQNIGFDGLTENFLSLVTFSCLIAPDCKSDFDEIFNSLISNIKRYENLSSMFKFFVCFCWQSKDYCDKISSDDKLTIFIQLLIGDKKSGNSFFIPNSDSNLNEKRNRYLLLLFAEIILFSGKNRAKIGDIVNATVLPYELENSISQLENSEYKDNSKFGQFEKQVISYINENHLHDSLDSNVDGNDFYKSEYDRLQRENGELKNKIKENEGNLNSLKIENDDKTAKIELLQGQIDELSNKSISKGIQLDDNLQSEDKITLNENENNTQNNDDEKINNLMNQISELKTQLEDKTAKIQSLEGQIDELSNKSISKEIQSENENVIQNNEDEKINNLMNQISELKSQLEYKNAELQNEESSKDQLRSQINDLSLQLSESNNKTESLEEQNKISSNELNQLRTSLENAQNISDDLQKQIQEKNDSISSLQSQNEQLKNKIERKSIETTELIEKFNKEISELRSQQSLQGGDLISSLNSQIEELRNENSKQKHEFENEKEILNQNIFKLQSEKSKLEDDKNSKNEELQRKIKEIEDLNSQNNEEKEKLVNENESLKSQLENSKEMDQIEIENLRNQIDELKSNSISNDEVDSIKKANIEITKQYSDLILRIHELENQAKNQTSKELTEENNIDELLRIKVDELENQLQQAVNESAEKDDIISSLQSQVKEAKKTQKANDKVANDLRKTNNDLQDQVTQMLKQIEELQLLTQYNHFFNLNSPQNQRNQNREIQIEYETSKKSSSKTKSTKSTTQSEYDENETENSIKPLKEQIEKLNNQVNNLQNENEQLQTQLSQSTKQESKTRNEEKELIERSLKEQIELLSNQVNNLQNENEQLQTQVQIYQNTNEEKEKELIVKPFKLQIEQLSNQVNNLQNENKQLQTQLSQSAKQESKALNEEKELIEKPLKLQIEQLNNQVNNLQNENEQLQIQVQLSKGTNEEKELIEKPLKEQIEQLNNQVNNLQNENEQLQTQVQMSQGTNEEKELIEKPLKLQIEQLNNQINNLQNENEQLQNQVQLSQGTNEEKELIEKPLKEQIEQLNNQVNNLQNENEKLQIQLSQSTKQKSQTLNEEKELIEKPFRKQIEQLSNQIDNLQTQNEQLQIQISKSTPQESNKDLINQNLQYEKLVVSLQEENIKLQEQIQSLKPKQTKKETAAAKEEEEDSSDFLDRSLIEQKNELINSLNNIKEDNKKLQNQVNNSGLLGSLIEEEEEEADEKETKPFKDQINQLNSKIDDLKDQNKKLQNQLNESLQNSSINNDGFLDSATKSKYENLITKQRKLIDNLRAQNEKLEASSVEATTNAEDLASQNEKLKSEIKTRSQESASKIQELKKKLSQIVKENNNLQEKINSIENQTQNKKKNHHKTKQQNEPNMNSKQRKVQQIDNNDILFISSENNENNNVDDLKSQISLLKAENEQLKNSPSKALFAALQEEKANLEEKVFKLNEEVNNLRKERNKQKVNDSNDDLLSSLPISPIKNKTMKKNSKSSKKNLEDNEMLNKLLTENEILKRDNENQSHTITDLQLMLEMQSIGSESQVFLPTTKGGMNSFRLPYSSFEDELKSLTVENEVLNSKLKEMNSIEIENKRLLNENMELKRLIRNRGVSSLLNDNVSNINNINNNTPIEISQRERESPNLSELKQRKALRVIGKLYLDKQQQKLNL